ncbi:phospholipase D family protein [Nitrobacter sp. TKz-YC01]|uniref:phospholipase D family protein n=1 Tax=Nitrobacter sp. TKz-YC01 TaxID=3398703 RepID=UPI003A0FF206
MEFIHQPARANRLGDFLIDNLQKSWPVFRAAIAFVKQSGTRHVVGPLAAFSKAGKSDLIVGIDHRGTSKEGLDDLLVGVGTSGRVVVFHNPIASTFHPKVYLFRSDAKAEVLVGSGNLTEGGIFTNYEASVHLNLDLSVADDVTMLQSIETVLDEWGNTSTGTARVLDSAFLTTLVARGYVPVEALTASERDDAATDGETADGGETTESTEVLEALFSARSVAHAPSVAWPRKSPPQVSGTTATTSAATIAASAVAMPNKGFVMTLQRTDVGTGQVTPGTSRRSPEIFVPLSARENDPDFWGWPSKFTPDTAKPGKFDRFGVRMRVGTEIANVNMMTWPDKHDCQDLRRRTRRSRHICWRA